MRLSVQGLLAGLLGMRLMSFERPHEPDPTGAEQVRGDLQSRVLPIREHLRQMQLLMLDLRHFPLALYLLPVGD